MLWRAAEEVLQQYHSGYPERLPLDTNLLITDLVEKLIAARPGPPGAPQWSCLNSRDLRKHDISLIKHIHNPGNNNRPHLKHAKLDPFDTLSLICLSSRLDDCTAAVCVESRNFMEQAAPQCRWTRFREYVLTLAACTRRQRADFLLGIIGHFRDFLKDTKEWPQLLWRQTEDADMYGALDLIYWIEPMLGKRYRLEPNLVQSLHSRMGVSMPPILDASAALSEINVCQKRLWDLVQGHERQECTLPSIVHLSRGLPPLLKTGHQDCTANHCPPTIENHTLATQKHTCAGHDCNTLKLDMHGLNTIDSSSSYPTSVWECKDRRFVADVMANGWRESNNYVAVSHVWSDGTGVGLKEAGTLNECLFDYFANVASRLGCSAVWWDTICLPSRREARSFAVSRMHENFRKAAFTVIHDQALLDMEWAEDGSPCLALVMSTWFSRGWTVLELWASENVKVLFKNPNDPSEPVIKDLENDILVMDETDVVHPAHRMASDVIRSVRRDFHPGRQHKNNLMSRQLLPRLLGLLQPRATSWATDRMIIAGLMARLEGFDAAWSQARITQEILTTFPVVHPAMLLHDKITMNRTGPWSWCPSSLLDLPLHHFTTFSKTVQVQDGGKVWGMWACQALTEETARSVRPCSPHLSVSLRIQEALRTWDKCLIMSPLDRRRPVSSFDPYLLVVQRTRYGQKIWHVPSSGRMCSTVDEYFAATPELAGMAGSHALRARACASLSTMDCEYVGAVVGRFEGNPTAMHIRLGHDFDFPSEDDEPPSPEPEKDEDIELVEAQAPRILFTPTSPERDRLASEPWKWTPFSSGGMTLEEVENAKKTAAALGLDSSPRVQGRQNAVDTYLPRSPR